jgi:hypothetical protein
MAYALSFCQVVLQPDLQVREIRMNGIPQNLEGVGQEVFKRQRSNETVDRND